MLTGQISLIKTLFRKTELQKTSLIVFCLHSLNDFVYTVILMITFKFNRLKQ